MDIVLVVVGFIILILGIFGCFLPVLPGPILSFVAIILLQIAYSPFSIEFLVIWGIVVILVTLLDSIIPVLGTKKLGGSKYGTTGSLIGLLIGIFTLPGIGMILGPFIGAYIGEYIKTNDMKKSFKPALGAFLGFITGVILKLAVSGILSFYFFREVVLVIGL